MSKIYCRVCNRIHDRKEKCITNIKKESKKDLRLTRTWRRIRQEILEEYFYIDIVAYAVCGRIIVADEVHHIISIKEREDLVYSTENLICVNHKIHKNIEGKYQDYLRDLKIRWKEGKVSLGCDRGVIPLDVPL